jgi:hypothetical protein
MIYIYKIEQLQSSLNEHSSMMTKSNNQNHIKITQCEEWINLIIINKQFNIF